MGLIAISASLGGCAASSRSSPSQIMPIDENQLRQLLREHRGRVVLLNFWATWCEPCVEEVPDLVRVAREHPERLVVIGVTIDGEEEVRAKVIPFLRNHAPPFVNYIKRTRDDEAFINSVDVKWSGAIPATFIYRPDGTLMQRLIGQQSYEKFVQALQTALKPSANPAQHEDVSP